MTNDTARVAGTNPPVLNTDGPCLAGTLATLGTGTKALSAASLTKIRADALELLGLVVSQYESEVARGEVGADGTGMAGPSSGHQCTGLLYGRIQSGKTVAMISLVAAAMDNGFRVVVVLTSDNVTLVSQTTDRFAALEGPIAIDARNPASWSGDQAHIKKHISRAGVVFVCSKNKSRLDGLISFLRDVDAPNFPALILDDEADQATLDANLAKRVNAKNKGKADVDPTAIYAKVVDDLRQTLRHHVFLQVTATPYALLLQSVGTALRPSFTRLLEPGDNYTGGESFFEAHHVDGPVPPICYVEADESESLKSGTQEAPEGLRKAIAFFLVAAGTQGLTDPERGRGRQNFLCHTSQLKSQHKNLYDLVLTYVNRVSDELDAGSGESVDRLQVAYQDLLHTFPNAPPFPSVLEQINRRLVKRKVVVVNAETDAAMGPGLNLIIGGNILGRGVTIENLLVTYYMREPKVGQMDTMLQHARMYGYRRELMPFTRVFLPPQLAIRFHEIHRIEGRLRKQLATADLGVPIPIERTGTLQATRRAVLDPDYLDAFSAGDQVFPIYPDLSLSSAEFEKLRERIRSLCGGTLPNDKADDVRSIDFDEMLLLIEEFPYDTKVESSSWVPRAIKSVLERQRERLQGRAYLHTRSMNRKKNHLPTGALEGEVLKSLRELDGPVFCAFKDDGLLIPNAKPFWYPTVVFDRKMPSVIVNVTDDGK
jgi:hypothetical protein